MDVTQMMEPDGTKRHPVCKLLPVYVGVTMPLLLRGGVTRPTGVENPGKHERVRGLVDQGMLWHPGHQEGQKNYLIKR